MSNKFLIRIFYLIIFSCLIVSCSQKNENIMSIEKVNFGKINENKVMLYILSNKNNMTVKITNYGGIITSIMLPDKNGKIGDVVLGYDSLSNYVENNPYFGAIIGRYGNRIANGKFNLNGTEYILAKNDGPNHLHGGLKGFDKVVWNAEEIQKEDTVGLKLSYLSKDGEEGYPGNLNVTVTYKLNNDNELRIDYSAVTDKRTIVNLTSHSYFNLKDAGASSILDHELMINADKFTPIDSTFIPTGNLSSVENTPFDFRKFRMIGERINDEAEQLKFGLGYDHNFVLNNSEKKLKLAAKVKENSSGRMFEVLTTEPGIQFYSGNFLDGSITGKNNIVYNYRNGFCLETQHFPDSPNHPNFPSTVLEPGTEYTSTTVYKFSVEKND